MKVLRIGQFSQSPVLAVIQHFNLLPDYEIEITNELYLLKFNFVKILNMTKHVNNKQIIESNLALKKLIPKKFRNKYIEKLYNVAPKKD